MSTSIPAPGSQYDAFERGTAPVMQILSVGQARQIVDFKPDDALRQRIEVLAVKCNNDELSVAERAEYEGYVRANLFVATLQAQARKFLKSAHEE